MSFGRRLQRLARQEPPAPDPAPAASPAERLRELRERLHELMGRHPGETARPPGRDRETSVRASGFESLPTPAGPVWLKSARLPSSQRLGRFPLSLAEAARPEALARLALDPSLAACRERGFLFLDTETTGLGGAGTLAFLIGLAGIEGDGTVWVEQLLLLEPAHEPALLERVRAHLERADSVVSFNGKSYDYPLLQSRAVMNRLPPLAQRPHLDLLHVGRRLHRPRLDRCSLTRVERDVLGFDRGPDIDGSEVPARYHEFLRTGDFRSVEAVVRHNHFDVLSMVLLVGLYGQPTPSLEGSDMTGFARTLWRSGAADAARRAASSARADGDLGAVRLQAEMAKSLGRHREAVEHFELFCREHHDPAAHLELAKLYEHRLRMPATALEWVREGTTEAAEDDLRRRRRLESKIRRKMDGSDPVAAEPAMGEAAAQPGRKSKGLQ